jgi:hypothetical protein
VELPIDLVAGLSRTSSANLPTRVALKLDSNLASGTTSILLPSKRPATEAPSSFRTNNVDTRVVDNFPLPLSVIKRQRYYLVILVCIF